VSHAWLSREHPDPAGLRLKELVDVVDRLKVPGSAVVFLDFCSLPQHDKMYLKHLAPGENVPPGHPALRTDTEERQFQLAMRGMQKLYTSNVSRVVVLCSVPSLPVKGYTMNDTRYWDRGWCFFEFSIACDYDRVVNPWDDSVKQLVKLAPRNMKEFSTALPNKGFTCSGDANCVKNMFSQLHLGGRLSAAICSQHCNEVALCGGKNAKYECGALVKVVADLVDYENEVDPGSNFVLEQVLDMYADPQKLWSWHSEGDDPAYQGTPRRALCLDIRRAMIRALEESCDRGHAVDVAKLLELSHRREVLTFGLEDRIQLLSGLVSRLQPTRPWWL